MMLNFFNIFIVSGVGADRSFEHQLLIAWLTKELSIRTKRENFLVLNLYYSHLVFSTPKNQDK